MDIDDPDLAEILSAIEYKSRQEFYKRQELKAIKTEYKNFLHGM